MKRYLLAACTALCATAQPYSVSAIMAKAALHNADLDSVRYADVNGDGLLDICFSAPSINQIYCSINTNGHFGTPTIWSNFFKSPTVETCNTSACHYTNTWSDPSVWKTIQFVDVDLDGKADVCGRQSDGYYCMLSTGHDFSLLGPHTTDFSDAQGWNNSESYYETIRVVNLGFSVDSGYFLNPSRLPGVCGRNSQGIFCDPPGFGPTGFCVSNGDGCSVRGFDFGDNLKWNSDRSYWSTIQFGDINGDGFADVCGRGSAGIVCATVNHQLVEIGESDCCIYASLVFDNVGVWTTQFNDNFGWKQPQYYSSIRLVDINGDGLADMCGRGNGGFYCATSSGSQFNNGFSVLASSFSDANGLFQDYQDLWLIDVSGDGLPDICGRGHAGIVCQINWSTLQNVQFGPAELWINNFGDNYGWNRVWDTVQAVDLRGTGFPRAAFCGVGDTSVWCSSLISVAVTTL